MKVILVADYMKAFNNGSSSKNMVDQIVIDFDQKPDIVFDDRPRVVKMWRANGVFVADVYQGTEDF